MTLKSPILYSFRRCPYAIRARLALAYTHIAVEHREVELKHKTPQLLAISPKGTVPVLHTSEGEVIEESLDIMLWALAQSDPQHWRDNETELKSKALITKNDTQFKYYLDRYKYADRFPEFSAFFYRQQAELFLLELEHCLTRQQYLVKPSLSFVDSAIFPFIRQFAHVDSEWFWQADYPKLQAWLQKQLDSDLFRQVMVKLPPWSFE